jgi:hypothetical protein
MSKELIAVLDKYAAGDEFQRPVEQAIDLLESQAREIEELKAKCNEWMAIRIPIQKYIGVVESQAREIELKDINLGLASEFQKQMWADWHEETKKHTAKIDELRAALVSAIDAMEDFDYDKRMQAIAKCREVL